MSNLQALSAPFPPHEIEWRLGSTKQDKTSGLALAYITSRHVMERLDEVVGPANWQDRYEVHGNRVICYLSLRIDGEWVTKADGAGDTHVEAEKGGISDALKRAAVKWGIGRYLYALGNIWVDCEQRGKSTFIKKGQDGKLIAALNALTGSNSNTPPPQQKPKTQADMRNAVEQKWLQERTGGIRMADNDSQRILNTLLEAIDITENLQDLALFASDNQENIGYLIDPHYIQLKQAFIARQNSNFGQKAAANG